MLTLSTLVILVDVMAVKMGMKPMWTLDLLRGGKYKKKVQYKKWREEDEETRDTQKYFSWSQQEQSFLLHG